MSHSERGRNPYAPLRAPAFLENATIQKPAPVSSWRPEACGEILKSLKNSLSSHLLNVAIESDKFNGSNGQTRNVYPSGHAGWVLGARAHCGAFQHEVRSPRPLRQTFTCSVLRDQDPSLSAHPAVTERAAPSFVPCPPRVPLPAQVQQLPAWNSLVTDVYTTSQKVSVRGPPGLRF